MRFCTVTSAVSAGFWIAGCFDRSSHFVEGLPLSAAMFLAPAVGAWSVRRSAPAGPLAQRRPVRSAVLSIGAWALPMPAVMAASYALMRLRDDDLPADLGLTVGSALGLLALFVVSGTCEEVGWSRFLTPALLSRSTALRVGVTIGALWAALHVIPYLQGGRSWDWVAWQCAFTIVFRVLIVVVLDARRRTWWDAVALHASCNLAWAGFPTGGSHYDPRYPTVLVVVLCGALLVLRKRTRGVSAARPTRRQRDQTAAP